MQSTLATSAAALLLAVSLSACSQDEPVPGPERDGSNAGSPFGSAPTSGDSAAEPGAAGDATEGAGEMTAESAEETEGSDVEESQAPFGAEASTEPADQTVPFGKSWDLPSGLQVTVSAPKKYTLTEYASAGGAEHNLFFTVKIVNNSGSSYDASLFSTSLQSGNQEAEEIYDSEGGLAGTPGTRILDGRESVFKIGYNLMDPKDLVMEVSVDWEQEPVFFVS